MNEGVHYNHSSVFGVLQMMLETSIMCIFTNLFDENDQIYQAFKNLKATFLKKKTS